eukprot:14857097-Ditylum_brightwellii.AAC.1
MTFEPPIPDSHWVNSDHTPMHRDDTFSYLWGVKNSDRRKISNGGADKDRFILQLTYAKDGTKLPLYLIFKGAYPTEVITQRRGSAAYEIQHCLPDNNVNNYPPVEMCVLACSPKGCSNGELTIDNLKKLFSQVLESLKAREEEYLLMILRDITDIL